MPKLKIFITGHKGMVGSALVRILKKKKVEIITKEKKELNLLNQKKVQTFFKNNKIDQVYMAAAKVGGIYANNSYPAEFIYQNLMIQNNIIHSAFLSGVKKLLFVGSSCAYPKNSKQPIKEEELLNGKLEPTNEPYAISKIAGIIMCKSYNRQYGNFYGVDYRCVMSTNVYGPGDNYHPQNSHVVAGLIRRFHEAKVNNLKFVTVWGSGSSLRELIYSDDMAQGSIQVMNLEKKKYKKIVGPLNHINIGSSQEVSIKVLAKKIKKIVDYKGKIKFDISKPEGTLRKIVDIKRLNKIGFRHKIDLENGLEQAYIDFKVRNSRQN